MSASVICGITNVPSLPQLPTPGLDAPSLTALPTPFALPDSSFLTGLGDTTTTSRSGLPATPQLPSTKDLPALGGIADLPDYARLCRDEHDCFRALKQLAGAAFEPNQ